MANRNRLPERGELRYVAADIVIEPDLSLGLEEEHRHRCELLRGRGDGHSGRVREGDAVRDIGHPETARIEDRPRPEDADDASGGVGPSEGGEDGRDAIVDRVAACG
jgi:hypothetical protein